MTMLKAEWVSCPSCAGSVELVEQIADTLTEQSHRWECEAGHTGVMAWTITARTDHARPARVDPITPRRNPIAAP